jgi:hypothetical protein
LADPPVPDISLLSIPAQQDGIILHSGQSGEQAKIPPKEVPRLNARIINDAINKAIV